MPLCEHAVGTSFGFTACVELPGPEGGGAAAAVDGQACLLEATCGAASTRADPEAASLEADIGSPADAECAILVATGASSADATCRRPPPPPVYVLRPVATITWVPCPTNQYQNCGTVTPGLGWSCVSSTSTSSSPWATCTSDDPAFRCSGILVAGSIPAARGFNVIDASASCGNGSATCNVVYGWTQGNRCVAGAAVSAGSNVVGCDMFNSNYYHTTLARATCYAY